MDPPPETRESTPEIVAYHESGHALVALLLGAKVRLLSIEPENGSPANDNPDDNNGPYRHGEAKILWRRSRMTEKEYAEKAVQVCLAGPVAEMIYTGDPWHPGLVSEWADDWRQAWQAAMAIHADDRKRLAYLEQASIRLYHHLKQDAPWAALAALADNLLAHETLEEEEVVEIVRQWLG